MKEKFKIIITLCFVLALFSCENRTYDDISGTKNVILVAKYTDHVKPIIDNNCVSCHSSSGTASYLPLTNYTEVKESIDGIIDRIKRPSGDPLKMPKGGSLSQSNIDIITQWKTDGLKE